MKINIEANPKEVAELLQAIGSSKEQSIMLPTSINSQGNTKDYKRILVKTDKSFSDSVVKESESAYLIVDSSGKPIIRIEKGKGITPYPLI